MSRSLLPWAVLRRRPRFLVAGVVAATVLALAPTWYASAAGTLTASFTATSDWNTAHEVRVTVTNGTSAPVDTWRIEFDLPAGTTINSFWDADVVRSGNHYVATKKSWAGALAEVEAGAVARRDESFFGHRGATSARGINRQRRRRRRRRSRSATS